MLLISLNKWIWVYPNWNMSYYIDSKFAYSKCLTKFSFLAAFWENSQYNATSQYYISIPSPSNIINVKLIVVCGIRSYRLLSRNKFQTRNVNVHVQNGCLNFRFWLSKEKIHNLKLYHKAKDVSHHQLCYLSHAFMSIWVCWIQQ